MVYYLNIIYSILAAKFLKLKKYFYVSWEITRSCNCRCLYCASWKDKHQELSIAKIKEIIDKLSDMNIRIIHFTGGEPFLHKNFMDILRYCDQKNMIVSIVSNGTILSANLKKLNCLKSIAFSLDGPQNIHDQIRGKGVYKKVIKNITLAKRLGLSLKIFTVISKLNYDKKYIKYILDLAKKYKLSVNFIFTYENILKSDLLNPLSLSQAERKKVIDYLLLLKRSGFRKYIINSCTGLFIQKNANSFLRNNCMVERVSFRINYLGYLRRCGQVNFKNKINILEKDFKSKLLLQEILKVCSYCTCSSRIESNLLLNLNQDALFNFLF